MLSLGNTRDKLKEKTATLLSKITANCFNKCELFYGTAQIRRPAVPLALVLGGLQVWLQIPKAKLELKATNWRLEAPAGLEAGFGSPPDAFF